MEDELKGTHARVLYVWKDNATYDIKADVEFGDHGLFLKNFEDADWASVPVAFFPYERVVAVLFE